MESSRDEKYFGLTKIFSTKCHRENWPALIAKPQQQECMTTLCTYLPRYKRWLCPDVWASLNLNSHIFLEIDLWVSGVSGRSRDILSYLRTSVDRAPPTRSHIPVTSVWPVVQFVITLWLRVKQQLTPRQKRDLKLFVTMKKFWRLLELTTYMGPCSTVNNWRDWLIFEVSKIDVSNV